MSSLQRSRSLLLGAVLFGAVEIAAFCEQPARTAAAGKCAEYHLSRVAFLLGCCGDLPVAYPGDRFPSPLDDAQRATLALREIDFALRRPCRQDRPEHHLDLVLNRIGAYVMRARERAQRVKSLADVDASLNDAAIAASELSGFAESHPDAAAKIWLWIAMTFRRSGRPLETIWFLTNVEEKCCRKGTPDAVQMAVIKADTWFDLAMYSAAADAYSAWLREASELSFCGRDRSLANVAELRRRGFTIKAYAEEHSSAGVCVPVGEWEPYAGLPK